MQYFSMAARRFQSNEMWRLALVLFTGQLLSLFLAVISFTSSYIANIGVNTPLTQSFFTYLSLLIVYGAIFLYRRQKILVPWYWYILLAFVDVQGNYLTVKAYQFSSITSVTLLDCWTIPWVIILTWFFLRTRYSLLQFMGAAVCIVGLLLVLLSDSGVSDGGGRNPLLGDVLVIAGTLSFAFSNVGEEFCVKNRDRVEVLAFYGVFGVLVSSLEISIFERKDIASVKWSPTMIALFAGYAAAAFLYSTLASFFLQMSGATLMNLSLLTSDLWAVLIRIFFYRQQVNWSYYISYVVVACGLIIYTLNDSNSSSEEANLDEEAKPLIADI